MKLIEVKGDSMSPTLNPNQIIVAKQINPNKISRMKIVVFSYLDKLLIKRVIGLPGDDVEIKDQNIDVNGEQIFSLAGTNSQYYNWTIPEDMVCLIGDNSSNSLDSRKIGLISKNSVKYQVIARIWPPKLFW